MAKASDLLGKTGGSGFGTPSGKPSAPIGGKGQPAGENNPKFQPPKAVKPTKGAKGGGGAAKGGGATSVRPKV
jgi:hypothetical protein